MSKSAVITARIDPDLKNNAESVFKKLGLSVAQAITLFYKQVELQRGLPFHLIIPNDETKMALEEAHSRKNLESFQNTHLFFEDLGI